MPRAIKKPWEKRDPFFGVMHRAVILPPFTFTVEQKRSLESWGFETEDQKAAERYIPQYLGHYVVQTERPEAKKTAHRELRRGLRLAKKLLPASNAFSEWYESASILSRYGLSRELGSQSEDIAEISELTQTLLEAIERIVEQTRKHEKESDGVTRQLIWNLAGLREKVTGAKPHRRHDPYANPPQDYGPFRDLAPFATRSNRPSGQGLDALIQEALQASKSTMGE